jgi:hypothetical protein
MMKLHPLAPLCAIHCLVLAACDMPNPEAMATAQANGVSEIPEVSQFAALFPGAYHFITHYSGTKGPSYWNSKAGLHGRYIVTLTFPIEFDATRTHPRRTGPAAIFLKEVSEVRTRADGTVDGTSYTTKQFKFGIEEWERVVKSGGDWSVLGIQMITDKPIEHFEKAWKSG